MVISYGLLSAEEEMGASIMQADHSAIEWNLFDCAKITLAAIVGLFYFREWYLIV